MSAESPDKLLAKWVQGDLTVEQAVGHLLQHLVAMHAQAAGHPQAASV